MADDSSLKTSAPIVVIGAREHNLKNITVEVPKGKIVVFTGVSGSGKSSLLFDTIYAEAQRQLIETFSSYARRRLPRISRPNVDEIHNLSPSIVIDQRRMGTTLTSTVGTATEIYTYLRLLFSRYGSPSIGTSDHFSFNAPAGLCPKCSGLGSEMVIDEDKLVDVNRSVVQGAILHSDYKLGGWWWRNLVNCGFYDPNKPVKDFTPEERFALLHMPPTRYRTERQGVEYDASYEGAISKLRRRYTDKEEGADACTRFFTYRECPECHGVRLKKAAREVIVNGRIIGELVFLEMPELKRWVDSLNGPIAGPLARKMSFSIQCLIDLGAGYLSLHRPVATLSGGESQRVKMAKQLDCDLMNLLYILDEPSIGLHPKDIGQLLRTMTALRDKGNSVLVVEHDPAVIQAADHVIDIGPGAGANGGSVLYSGPVSGLRNSGTETARYLLDRPARRRRRRPWNDSYAIEDANLHNLKDISVKVPKGILVCVTGVAGSGKSTLVHGVFCKQHPEAVVVDQTAIGRSSRSNPMTYIGAFDLIRKEFGKATGRDPSLFSFNNPEGACPKCRGSGVLTMDMSFLDSVRMICDECDGQRYSEEVLDIRYKGRNIAEVLDMTVAEAIDFFQGREVVRRLKVLREVGLDYLELGQSLSSLSSGEAQRIKLATELQKSGNIYVMDEPTTGLHMADIERLLKIIDGLVQGGNTVIVIEHNLDIIASADWIIDLGPEGGSKGGYIIAQGTPEDVAMNDASATGRFLQDLLKNRI